MKDHKPVPAWLVHLVAVVPGAIAPRVRTDPAARHAVEDAIPGLFDAPQRVEPATTSTETKKGAQR